MSLFCDKQLLLITIINSYVQVSNKLSQLVLYHKENGILLIHETKHCWIWHIFPNACVVRVWDICRIDEINRKTDVFLVLSPNKREFPNSFEAAWGDPYPRHNS